MSLKGIKRHFPFFLLFLGGFLIFFSDVGRVEVLEENVVVPPNDFMEWNLNLGMGATINVVVDVDMEVNESSKALIELYIMDKKDFSNYAIENFGSIHLHPRQRTFVEADWIETLHYRVPYISNWHVILNNKIRVSYRDQAKDVHIKIYITTPYGYLIYPGLLLFSFGLAILIWQNRSIFLRLRKNRKSNLESDDRR